MDSYRRTTDRLGDDSRQLCAPALPVSSTLSRSLSWTLGKGQDIGKNPRQVLMAWSEFRCSTVVYSMSRMPERNSGQTRKAPLQLLPVISEPFLRIGMGLVRPLPRTKLNNRHIIVVMDYTTRWPEAFLLSTTESRAIADELLVLFTRVSVPNE